MNNFGKFASAIVAAVIIFYKVYGNTEQGRMNLAKWALKVPILGNIQQLNAASEFANTLTTMLSSGLPMTKAISILGCATVVRCTIGSAAASMPS